MVMVCFDLSMNLWIILKRRQFLLEIANSDVDIEELKRLYKLSEEDLEEMQKLALERQFTLISYGDRGPGYIGDYAPVIVMHKDKKEEVKEQNEAVRKRFAEALRELV